MTPPPKTRWREGPVETRPHFLLVPAGFDQPIARVGRSEDPDVFLVEFSPRRWDGFEDAMRRARRQVDYYLVDNSEPDPWNYARYHTTTASNVYSKLRWVLVE